MVPPPRYGRSLTHKARQRTPGHHYNASFLSAADRTEILAWLGTLHPLWEQRYSKHFPPPPGQEQRRLLRPVYWLGNWQFACLDYYRPPKGVKDRCVKAEPFPAVLQRQVDKVEQLARRMFRGPDMPPGWHLNTCLVNFYGSRLEDGRWVDTARVGEHKDFEPGPVASLSFGERALIQFVTSTRPRCRTSGPGAQPARHPPAALLNPFAPARPLKQGPHSAYSPTAWMRRACPGSRPWWSS